MTNYEENIYLLNLIQDRLNTLDNEYNEKRKVLLKKAREISINIKKENKTK